MRDARDRGIEKARERKGRAEKGRYAAKFEGETEGESMKQRPLVHCPCLLCSLSLPRLMLLTGHQPGFFETCVGLAGEWMHVLFGSLVPPAP
jgi:hypothetical protein